MSAQYRQSNHTDSPSGSNPYTLQFQGLQRAGSCNVVLVMWFDNTRTVTGVTDSHSQTYLSETASNYTSHGGQQIWYFPNIVGDTSTPNTISVTFSATPTTPISITIAEYNGVVSSSPVDLFESKAGTTATNPTYTSTGATTTATSSNPDLVIGFLSQPGAAATATAGSSCTVRTPSSGAYTGNSYIEDKNVTNNATQTVSFTQASKSYLLSLMALKSQASLALTGLTIAASTAITAITFALCQPVNATSTSSSNIHATLRYVDYSSGSASFTLKPFVDLGVKSYASSSLAAITPRLTYRPFLTSSCTSSSSIIGRIRILKSLTSTGSAAIVPRIILPVNSISLSSAHFNINARILFSASSGSSSKMGSSSISPGLSTVANSFASFHTGSLIYFRPIPISSSISSSKFQIRIRNIISGSSNSSASFNERLRLLISPSSSSLSLFNERIRILISPSGSSLVSASEKLRPVILDNSTSSSVFTVRVLAGGGNIYPGISAESVGTTIFHGSEYPQGLSIGSALFNINLNSGYSDVTPGLIGLSNGNSTITTERIVFIDSLIALSTSSTVSHGKEKQILQSGSKSSINLSLPIANTIRPTLISSAATHASFSVEFPNKVRITDNYISNSSATFTVRILSYGPIPQKSSSSAIFSIELNYAHAPGFCNSFSTSSVSPRINTRVHISVSSLSSGSLLFKIRPTASSPSHSNSLSGISIRFLIRPRPTSSSNSLYLAASINKLNGNTEEFLSASSSGRSSYNTRLHTQPLYSKGLTSASHSVFSPRGIYRSTLASQGEAVAQINNPTLVLEESLQSNSNSSSIITLSGPLNVEEFLIGQSSSLSSFNPTLIFDSSVISLSSGTSLIRIRSILRINLSYSSLSSSLLSARRIGRWPLIAYSHSQSSVSDSLLSRPWKNVPASGYAIIQFTRYSKPIPFTSQSGSSALINVRFLQKIKLSGESFSYSQFIAGSSSNRLRVPFSASLNSNANINPGYLSGIPSINASSHGNADINYSYILAVHSFLVTTLSNATLAGSLIRNITGFSAYSNSNSVEYTPNAVINLKLNAVSSGSSGSVIKLPIEIKKFTSKSSGAAGLSYSKVVRVAIVSESQGTSNYSQFWLINTADITECQLMAETDSSASVNNAHIPSIEQFLISSGLSESRISITLKGRIPHHRPRITHIKRTHPVIIRYNN